VLSDALRCGSPDAEISHIRLARPQLESIVSVLSFYAKPIMMGTASHNSWRPRVKFIIGHAQQLSVESARLLAEVRADYALNEGNRYLSVCREFWNGSFWSVRHVPGSQCCNFSYGNLCFPAIQFHEIYLLHFNTGAKADILYGTA